LQFAKNNSNLEEMKIDYQYLADLYNEEAMLPGSSVQKRGEYAVKSLEYYKLYLSAHDSLCNSDNTKKFTQLEMQYSFDKKESLAKAEQGKKDDEALKKMQTQRLIRNVLIGGFAAVLLFAALFWSQRNTIKKGKKRSDDLLLNILPAEVAEELKVKGSAQAKQFDEVTVMFTDFKNFTQFSEKLSPAELVAEIHTCFKAFDDITGKYHIEKIKTIGDSYMCAGGLPVINKTNATDVVHAALEIRQFILDYFDQRIKIGKEPFEIRIGIHTGPVVAGIVGIKKFAYDIWGDTVNIASRMESSGEAGKVNISGATYELVKEKFNCTHRGKVIAKNKGEIDMYFVESILY
jgi:adenylate cyclase